MVSELTLATLLTQLLQQSKDKFLSAASSDGFGFCSVILFVHAFICVFVSDWHCSGWDIHDAGLWSHPR